MGQEDEYYLNRSLFPLANEDVVSKLLSFEAHPWNFDSNNRQS